MIPVADDPNAVVIPKRTPNTIIKKLSYLLLTNGIKILHRCLEDVKTGNRGREALS
jgi:hypothetical protein